MFDYEYLYVKNFIFKKQMRIIKKYRFSNKKITLCLMCFHYKYVYQ